MRIRIALHLYCISYFGYGLWKSGV